MGDPLREALDRCSPAGSACLLRREGALLVPEPSSGIAPAAGAGTIPLEIALKGREGEPSPPVVLCGPAALAPLREIIGSEAEAAFLCPVSPPSLEGGHDRYLLVWIAAGDQAQDPAGLSALRAKVAALAEAVSSSAENREARDSASPFREAFEANSSGLILAQEGGRIVTINRAGSRAAGPATTLRPGDLLFEVVAPRACDRLKSLMQSAQAGAYAEEEIDFAAEGEDPRPQQVAVDLLRRDGEPIFLIGLRALTERDRLVDLLRRQKDFTRSLLEAANACVLGVDVQGRTILFNRVLQDLSGYRLADVLGRDAVELLVPEKQRLAWRATHLRALDGDLVSDQDLWARTRWGQNRILCLSAGRINDTAGACRGVLWTGRDVTEERRREAELRDREEMTSRSLRQLKEFSRISSMILQEKDLESVCRMFVNAISEVSTFRRAILTLCDDDFRGYCWYFSNLTEEEIETFHRNKMTGRERVTIFQERFRLGNSYYIPHSECWDYEGVRSRADATEMVDWHPDDFLFIPLYGANKKIVGILSVDDPQDGRRPAAESISPLELFANQVAHTIEERRLDQEVHQSTERYRTLVETMRDGIISVNLREKVLFANAALAGLIGIPEMLLTGRVLGTLMESEDLETFRSETALHEGGRVAAFEMRLRSQSGEMIPVHVSASPFLEAGALAGCFAVIRDLREQKAAEAERKAMQEQLMQAEKLSALGELISGIAHELNNPLTGVMGYSQLLLASDMAQEARKNLEKINKEAVRCQKIVQNLLTFARRRAPERKMIDVNALVDATLELRAYQLKVDGIEVIKELDEKIPRTLGDFHQLQQVFLNIINNAHHAILDTGRPGALKIRTESDGGVVRIRFADSGPGISQEHLKKIFDPFFTTKGIGKGTGLGLSLSYGIVKEHDGRIEVASRPGHGATFTVELPIRDEEIHPEEPAPAVEGEAHVESRSILVVDDEETILELLESVLEASGHRVETATNGRQALEKIRRADYDIIITDVKMPDMGGQKLYECVSEIKPHLRRRMVFSTGDTVNPATQALFQTTGNLYLAKPFRLEEVDEIISRVLKECAGDPVPGTN